MSLFEDETGSEYTPGDHHLATLLSAYVDEQLAKTDAECVEAHLVTCQECAEAVTEIREVRRVLAAPPVTMPSTALLNRLTLIEEVEAAQAPPAPKDERKWPTRLAVMAFGLAASMAGLALLGTHDLPDVTDTMAQRTQNSLLNQGIAAPQFVAAVSTFEEAGSLEPELRSLASRIPDIELIAVTRDADRDEFEAVMSLESAQVVVRDRRGKLPAGEKALGHVVEVAGHEVQVVSQAPWTAVWQRGDRVVSVAADAPHDTIALIIESFPPVPVDDGLGARVMRGVHRVGQVIG